MALIFAAVGGILYNILKIAETEGGGRVAMPTDFIFYLNSAAFGVGLAMDAFSVSMANGLGEPLMKKRRICLIAGIFAAFQIIMPLIGWFCVRTVAVAFESFTTFIPWIALILLLYIGGKMIVEAVVVKPEKKAEAEPADAKDAARAGDGVGSGVGIGELLIQGIATSIDALSVGFTIAELDAGDAVLESLIIGGVTFVICVAGVLIGKRFGTRLGRRASILGGAILIAIGIEIFISGII